MSSTRKIIVVVEPDKHPYDVVDRATWISNITGHDLNLLLCNSGIGPSGAPYFLSNESRDIGDRIRAAQNEMLAEFVTAATQGGANATGSVLDERPIADAIIQRALDSNPAFVIKGTQFHSIAERSLFADTDWQLLRSCPCPLWLVKPVKNRKKPVIIAAVDPTHSHDKPAALDNAIVEYAGNIAARAGGEVHLLHTYHRLTGIGDAATRTFKPIQLPIDSLVEKMRQEHREKLDALAATHGIDATHTHQLPGSAHDLIPSFARSRKADLVVMGALARWGLKRAIIGSTAERVMDHLPCDILIVRAG
jgi:universal stress protein E